MLTAQNVSFEYDDTIVLQKTSFSVSAGDRVGLVGPNGVGKSTLLKILAGILQPEDGKVLRPNDLTVGYLPQEIEEYGKYTGLEFLEIVTGCKDALDKLEKATELYGSDQNEEHLRLYEAAYAKVDGLGAYTLENRIKKVLQKVGLDTQVLTIKVSTLSGGQKNKLSLSAILLAKFDVFLLDEPTNNLDLDGLSTLENFIRQSKSAFVIVSHDRRFLRQATNRIAELIPDKGIRIYTLGYDEYVEARRKQNESAMQKYEQFTEEKKRLSEAAREKQQNAQAAAGNKSASDNEKIGRNARREKAVRSHARAAASLVSRLDQLEQPDKPMKDLDLNFRFKTDSEKTGATAIEVTDVTVDLGTKQFGPYSLKVATRDKVVIIGPNGGGKTTLLKLIAGLLPAKSGTINIANGITLSYIDQDYSFPDPKRNIITNLRKMTGKQLPELYNILAKFNIKKEKAVSLPGQLSPGQRSRALLAGAVAKGANLLLLDEPTNHLDISASDELQAALKEFVGTLVLVTHDRELMDTIVDKKVIVVGDGHIMPETDAQQYIHRVLKA